MSVQRGSSPSPLARDMSARLCSYCTNIAFRLCLLEPGPMHYDRFALQIFGRGYWIAGQLTYTKRDRCALARCHGAQGAHSGVWTAKVFHDNGEVHRFLGSAVVYPRGGVGGSDVETRRDFRRRALARRGSFQDACNSWRIYGAAQQKGPVARPRSFWCVKRARLRSRLCGSRSRSLSRQPWRAGRGRLHPR